MFKSLTVVFAIVFLAGCVSSSSVNYYTLNNTSEHKISVNSQKKKSIILLQEISFPEYLQSKYIATKSGSNKIELSDVNNWVEPLNDMVTDYITERLTQTMKDSIIISTTRYTKADKKVRIKILSLEKNDITGEVGLNARWAILNGKTNLPIIQKLFSKSIKPKDNSYGASAATHSILLDQLVQEIAKQL